MNQEEWNALVARLEPEARANPKSYRRKVLLVGILGYAFIAVFLLVLVGLAVGIIYAAVNSSAILIKIVIPVVALLYVVVRSLPVKVDPPPGEEIHKADAPALFAMIDEVSRTIQAPKISKVIVNGEVNAAIVQISRAAGLLGQRNYLLLGLPYMQVLSAQELKAVVAHELGHLSRNHGKFGVWVYRIRARWWQLLGTLEAEGRASAWIIRKFFVWYVPFFDAYSFPLMRQHEFEADEAAADATSPMDAATSLVTATVSGRYLHEEWWPKIFKRANDEPSPVTAFTTLGPDIAASRYHHQGAVWFDDELAREPDPSDTHPSIKERFEHLGLTPAEVFAAATAQVAGERRTAADEYLGASQTRLADNVQRAWSNDIRSAWGERHREMGKAKERLAELDAADELSPEDAQEQADLTLELRGEAAAVPLYRALVERDPANARANYGLGHTLLELDDESGLRYLDAAMDADAEAVLPGCGTAIGWLRARDRDAEAQRYRDRRTEQMGTFKLASSERESVDENDTFDPHGLPPETIDAVCKQLTYSDVKEAFLVRKRVEHLGDQFPFFVLVLKGKRTYDDGPTLSQKIAASIELPGDCQVIQPGRKSKLPERVAAVEGARIFSRG